ncbi:ABC transporter ATP-binding protein [Actinomyces bowdenii]|uniref:ATP-binding cassette domain-containing protein n=1 Tax=Actinomyces bowdenii TaxID=131109 RepID=A0A3P1VAP7_9ACTO|nr:ATP-binding cassette domain-containing protein [Actinomyces bowdenii]RRD30818.1 ATP-binding cassette domain-containing protein [Actinomyces bowdenii]
MIELDVRRKEFREPNGQVRTLFEGLRLSLGQEDHSVAVCGRSGSGKTTLLRILAGLDTAFEGRYVFRGQELGLRAAPMARHRAAHIGYITQRFDLLTDRHVLDNVAMAAQDRRRSRRRQRALSALAAVGLEGYGGKDVRRLSGGEAQRVAIARAVVGRPDLVLADEPTGSLDEGTETEILELFADLRERGTRFVIATHSETVSSWCARSLRIEGRALRD